MGISLYQSTVLSYLQIVPSILICLEKARKFCEEKGIDRNEFVDARLYGDMLPLHFQIITLVHFSEGALAAAKEGTIGGPDMTLEFSYDELHVYLEESLGRLKSLTPEQINGLVGGEVVFSYDDVNLPFTTEDFFLTYASPNFYFHATIIYAILRSLGVPIGIANYIGKVKTTLSSQISSEKHQYNGEEYLALLEQLAGR